MDLAIAWVIGTLVFLGVFGLAALVAAKWPSKRAKDGVVPQDDQGFSPP